MTTISTRSSSASSSSQSDALKKFRGLRADQPFFVSEPLHQTGRVMLKDENLCVHCGLCAERCPTGAWDMQKSTLSIPYARDEGPQTLDQWQISRKAG